VTIGPVQLLVVGFEGGEFKGEIRAELDRLRESDVVRLIDLAFVQKDDDGTVRMLRHTDLSGEELRDLGGRVGALVGLGAAGEEGALAGAAAGAEAASEGHLIGDDEVWYVEDAIPEGSAAAIALVEHRWAIPLREAIRRAGGEHLADAWIHPSDLVAIGALGAEEAALH
jgi:uncharacterized membrane protein